MFAVLTGAGLSVAAGLNASFLPDDEWIAFIGGLAVAGVVHVGKSSARPAINLGSARRRRHAEHAT